MTRMLCLALLLPLFASAACQPTEPLPGEGEDTGKTVVYRDTWGVPHIYAPTIADGLYAMGYAQAEDRPEQLLQNFLIAIGQVASIAGSGGVPSDLRSHMFDHYGAGQRGFTRLSTEMQGEVQAFADGINAFYSEHPEDLPVWWGEREVDAAMVLAFGRLFLYNWSIDEAYSDLIRGGVQPVWEKTLRGSNQFAVAPSRSASGAAILAIDPHLGWDGPSRFWEVRFHAGAIHGSGVTLPGSPYIGLGHNENVSWAMTTGGPDTADVFELELRGEEDALQYRFDGIWRDLDRRDLTLAVRSAEGVDQQDHVVWFSHHGPLIARQGSKAYAAKIAYGDMVTLEAWRAFNLAESYEGIEQGLADSSLFPQNIMAADVEGNIYYQRTGRVPRRSLDFDWSKPVDGTTSATEWQGIHPATDHPHILNPQQGWMQNCNIPPDAMMPNSPFKPADYPPYLWADASHGIPRSGWTNQRGARAVELLSGDDSVTTEEAIAYINDIEPFGVDRWVKALQHAHDLTGDDAPENAPPMQRVSALSALRDWDLLLQADSVPALHFAVWREVLESKTFRANGRRIGGLIDDWYAIIRGEEPKAVELNSADASILVEAFDQALEEIRDDYGSYEATYGDRYRVGRDNDSWAVEGGAGRSGVTTLRVVGFGAERDDRMRRGTRGQTSTQVVVMTDPVQSWIYIPWGQSDRPDSPHFDDQAEKLFAKRQLKESWWLPEDLAAHIASRTVLNRGGTSD